MGNCSSYYQVYKGKPFVPPTRFLRRVLGEDGFLAQLSFAFFEPSANELATCLFPESPLAPSKDYRFHSDLISLWDGDYFRYVPLLMNHIIFSNTSLDPHSTKEHVGRCDSERESKAHEIGRAHV